jgi:hypothetical protein
MLHGRASSSSMARPSPVVLWLVRHSAYLPVEELKISSKTRIWYSRLKRNLTVIPDYYGSISTYIYLSGTSFKLCRCDQGCFALLPEAWRLSTGGLVGVNCLLSLAHPCSESSIKSFQVSGPWTQRRRLRIANPHIHIRRGSHFQAARCTD